MACSNRSSFIATQRKERTGVKVQPFPLVTVGALWPDAITPRKVEDFSCCRPRDEKVAPEQGRDVR
jgi:hypothetical protein